MAQTPRLDQAQPAPGTAGAARPGAVRIVGMTARRVWIGLGANLGDPAANVLAAARRLAALPGVGAVRLSPLYDTAPWGVTDQPWFVNAAAELETDLGPEPLLDALLATEAAMGRVRRERWGPRVIDLDYLLDEAGPVATERLVVPHPGLEDRASVLAPLADLRPDLVLPSGRPIAERLAELLPDQPVRRRVDAPAEP
jgi:2-amino-4-hydroxy-6-hydroxymethyldihydropteridine diphosphokinase